jgi:hypothetical protein
VTDAHRAVDIIARLAESWDGRGRHALSPPTEHEALLAIARLPAGVYGTRWEGLSVDQRRHLLFAVRRAVELGKLCAWFFGEPYGGVPEQVRLQQARIHELERELAEVRRQLAAANAVALERVFGQGRGT